MLRNCPPIWQLYCNTVIQLSKTGWNSTCKSVCMRESKTYPCMQGLMESNWSLWSYHSASSHVVRLKSGGHDAVRAWLGSAFWNTSRDYTYNFSFKIVKDPSVGPLEL